MHIRERETGDLKQLHACIRTEKNADRRDRLRAVVLALEGEDAPTIVRLLGRSRRQIQDWAYAYRDGGIDAIHPPKPKGKPARVRGEIAEQLKARLDAGPTQRDKVCTLRGKDVQRTLCEEMGVTLSLNAAYATLHRLGYSCLAPRPRHEKQNPAAQQQFKEESAPFLSTPCAHSRARAACVSLVFLMDEARFGQQGTTTRVWAKRGSRPTAVKQTRYEWLYLYVAVELATGCSVALQAPDVYTGTMNVLLKMLCTQLRADACVRLDGTTDHAVLIMDRAGWHRSKQLAVPDNITILHLPAYSPGTEPGRASVGAPAQPPHEQPCVRRLRPPAGRNRRRVARAHHRRAQIRLPMRLHPARSGTVIRISPA